MKNPNIKTKVVHSQSKSAWNVIGDIPGGKYKIARIPYLTTDDEISTSRYRKESLEHAQFISYCFNNSNTILEKPVTKQS